MHNLNKERIKSSLRFKKERVITKKDYRRAFVNNPRLFLKREAITDYFFSYITSPSSTETINKMRFFLFVDNIVQFVRKILKFLFVDKPTILLIFCIILISFIEVHIIPKGIFSLILLIAFILNLSVYLFYAVDHMISIFATFKSSLNASSEYLAKSYLDLTKIKSDTIDFLYFDKDIDYENRRMYEEWTTELLDKIPIMNSFNFNIYIANENTNILDESRKMVAIYDTPYQKVYEHSIASLGLYNPAGTTVISKSITKEYFNNIIEVFKDIKLNEDVVAYGKDIDYFKKYNFYHEISHMITIDLYPILLNNNRYISAFESERHLLFPSEGDYFASDIKEYTAECLARFLLEGHVGDLNIDVDFRDTETYKMIKYFTNRLIKAKF